MSGHQVDSKDGNYERVKRTDFLQSTLSMLGRDGWELVSVVPTAQWLSKGVNNTTYQASVAASIRLVFKRPVTKRSATADIRTLSKAQVAELLGQT